MFHHVCPSFSRPEISRASKEVQGATGQLQGNPRTLDGRRTLCHGCTHQKHCGNHSHHRSEGRHRLPGKDRWIDDLNCRSFHRRFLYVCQVDGEVIASEVTSQLKSARSGATIFILHLSTRVYIYIYIYIYIKSFLPRHSCQSCLTEARREGIEANSQEDGSQNHLEGGHDNPSSIHGDHGTQNQLANQGSHKDTSKGG